MTSSIDLLDYKEEAKAIRYNNKRDYRPDLVQRIQILVGVSPTSAWNEDTVEAVAQWQHLKDLTVDGMVGPTTKSQLTAEFEDTTKPLTETEKDAIIAFTVRHEGGGSAPYSACNRDGEWKGLFDRPKRDKNRKRIPVHKRDQYPDFRANGHSQYHESGGSHVGLSWGAWQVTQDAGSLGQVLQIAFEEDPELFYKVFDGEKRAKELLEVLTRKGKRKEGERRSSRVQPVCGEDAWNEPWLSCFKEAGKHEVFRRAQRRKIVRRLNKILDPDKELNVWKYNLTMQGEIAVLFDISVQFGSGGMRTRWRRAIKKAKKAKRALTIHDVINELPEARRNRRLSILKSADAWVRYERVEE